jgi:hypothetical protein
MRWLQLGILAEFADQSGIIRCTGGCSLVGRFEFGQRLEQLQELLGELPPDGCWGDEYGRGGRFAHVVDRLLELNGLQADWFTLEMVSTLLFGRVDERGDVQPGWLVTLNQGSSATLTDLNKSAPTMAESIAGLSESLVEALDLAENLPASLLMDIAAARSEMYKTDEQRAEAKKQQIFDELRNDSRLEEILRQD